jgi:hypothetical protein
MADAIKEQNWFTVALEMLIVVVGIFIGLQVNDWNQARVDRVLESRYLERLQADLSMVWRSAIVPERAQSASVVPSGNVVAISVTIWKSLETSLPLFTLKKPLPWLPA